MISDLIILLLYDLLQKTIQQPFLWKCFCLCANHLEPSPKKKLLQKYRKARHQKGRRNCWYFPSLTKTSFPSGLKLRPTFRRRKLGSRGLDLGREGRTFAPDLSGLILLMWEVIMDGKKGKDAVPRRCLGKMDVCVWDTWFLSLLKDLMIVAYKLFPNMNWWKYWSPQGRPCIGTKVWFVK